MTKSQNAKARAISGKKTIPSFATEDEEREFWSDADSSDYVDWDKAETIVLSELKPSQKTISIRMSEIMLGELKRLANKQDVPYQSLLKTFLAERLEQERRNANQ